MSQIENHPAITPEHVQFRDMVRRFASEEIEPFASEWDEAESFPIELYRKAGSLGLLGLGFPEEYGGFPGDHFHFIILAQELALSGAGGVCASLSSHAIGAPPIATLGSPELKARTLPPIIAGEKVCALAITESSGGSDVRAIRTKATRRGDQIIVEGEKTFISSGMRAEVITVAVRLADSAEDDLAFLVIEGNPPGLKREALKKMGWWSSDTATLRFDGVSVPAANLLNYGPPGFRPILNNFNKERLMMAAQCLSNSQLCLEESVSWAKSRIIYGKPLIEQQVIRHKLADMAMRINATQALIEQLAWRMDQGAKLVGEIALAKNQATQTLAYCATEAVQIHGGMGFMRGVKVERLYRDMKVMQIGGGAEEVLKELAAKQFDWV